MKPECVEIVPVRNTVELWTCAQSLAEVCSQLCQEKVTYATAYNRLKCAYHTPGFMGWVVMLNAKPIGGCVGNLMSGEASFQLKELFLTEEWVGSSLGPLLIEKVKAILHHSGVMTLSLYAD